MAAAIHKANKVFLFIPILQGMGWRHRPMVGSAVGPGGDGQGWSVRENFSRGTPP